MLRRLHHLDSRLVANFHTNIRRQRDLRQTEGAGVRVVGRAGDLEGRDDGVAHVLGGLAEAKVDIDQGSLVAREPSGLDCDGAAQDGPFGAVLGCWHAAAWKREL